MADALALEAIQPSELPSPPQAAIQIMRACCSEESSVAELSKLASSDPVLTAELLRVVNSPFFGLGREVQSIARAVTVLGQRTLRNIALCISVRDALRNEALPGFDSTSFWEEALLRAVSARALGSIAGLDEDDCFTAGILQDFGLLVMFHLRPDKVSAWKRMQVQSPDVRRSMELEHFGTTHDAVAHALACAWDLPPDLTAALGEHHECAAASDTDHSALAWVLYGADWMAAVYRCYDKGHAIKRCRALLEKRFGIGEHDADDHLSAAPSHAESAAAALGLRIEQAMDFEKVLSEANLMLAEQNREYQELTWLLEKTLKERDRLARELHEELRIAREIQQGLLPHGADTSALVSGVNVAARQLSGDFYDYFWLPDGRMYFNLGDVSGKGVNAALLMAKTCSLFRCLGKRDENPARVLAQINKEICETSVRGMFVTMVAGIFDPGSDHVHLVNAGHMPALIVQRNGRVTKVDAQSPPLGVDSGSEFCCEGVGLNGGDIYLYSDGATEARVSGTEVLGLRGMLSLLLKHREGTPQQILESLVDAISGNALPLRDDVTFLMVRSRACAPGI